MSVISFELKARRACANNVKEEQEKLESIDGGGGGNGHHLSFLSSKVIHFGRFLRLKQSAHWENIKMRNGLVLKIHKARRQAEDALKVIIVNNSSEPSSVRSQELTEEILDLASDYSDYIIYGEATTLELLNKYWEFKNLAESKVNELTKFKFAES
jgi:hypothetical protein